MQQSMSLLANAIAFQVGYIPDSEAQTMQAAVENAEPSDWVPSENDSQSLSMAQNKLLLSVLLLISDPVFIRSPNRNSDFQCFYYDPIQFIFGAPIETVFFMKRKSEAAELLLQ